MFVDHDSEHFKHLVKQFGFNPERFHIFESLTRGFSGSAVECKKQALDLLKENQEAFIDRYLDVRLFGTTCLPEKSKDENGKKASKKSADDGDFVSLKRQGPVTISVAKSVAPVDVFPMSYTKKAPLRDDHLQSEQGDIAPGAFKMVDHALCVASIVVNPTVVGDLGTSEEDIEVLKSTLKYIFSTSSSASRPAGSIRMARLWWAEHDNPLGSFNEFDFWDKLRPKKIDSPDAPSKSIDDYVIPEAPTVVPFEIVNLV
jgi:Cas7 group CRISPR-associated protein Csh2